MVREWYSALYTAAQGTPPVIDVYLAWGRDGGAATQLTRLMRRVNSICHTIRKGMYVRSATSVAPVRRRTGRLASSRANRLAEHQYTL